MAEAARTKTACRVADIDRQKLTDAIASGDYPCAPATSAGVARVFEIDDLVALFIFARMTERGEPSRKAGQLACRLRDSMRSYPAADQVLIAHGINGTSFCAPRDEHWNPDGRNVVPNVPILRTEVWDVRNVREIVRRNLEAESRIVGDD